MMKLKKNKNHGKIMENFFCSIWVNSTNLLVATRDQDKKKLDFQQKDLAKIKIQIKKH